MSQKRDTDYLAVSTRIHAMENRMLTRERMERMIDAKDSGEAAKVLSECGYGELTQLTSAALEELLADARRNTFRDMTDSVPDRRLVEVFQLKYDYHNAKVLIKAQAMGLDEARSNEAVRISWSHDTKVDFSALVNYVRSITD